MLDIPVLNLSERADSYAPSFDRTGPVQAGRRQAGRGLEPEDSPLSTRTLSDEEFIDDIGLSERSHSAEAGDDDEPVDDMTRQNWQRLGILDQPDGSPGFQPVQGIGRGAMYSPGVHNQATTDNPYPCVNRANGVTIDEGLPLPGEYQ
jgi:hypothetical protein